VSTETETAAGELLPAPRPAGALAPAEDRATAAVLAVLDQAADTELESARPTKTRAGYARDWTLWCEYLDWLATRTGGHRLPDTAVTRGTLVGFVVWLDELHAAALSTIDRRITGVTVTARRHGAEPPKEATKAAREYLKRLAADPARRARGRGKAVAATPANLRAITTAEGRPRPGSRKRHRTVPETALLRDRALALVAFAIGGRAAEVSALTVEGIVLEAEGLRITVPGVKGRPERTVPVAYGQHPETCPVRAWLAWKEAAALEAGPAFRPVDEVGRIGERRLSPDSCRKVITRAAERAGIDAKLTGHSMRAGLVTTGRKAGKRVEKLRAQTGHAANSPVFWEYVRAGELWEDAATDGIGL
jgi:integrase